MWMAVATDSDRADFARGVRQEPREGTSGGLWWFIDRGFCFFQAEDGIRDIGVTGVQTCALPIWRFSAKTCAPAGWNRKTLAAWAKRREAPRDRTAPVDRNTGGILANSATSYEGKACTRL